MLNLIKADLGRIKRSNWVWIMPVIMAGLCITVCALFAGLKFLAELDLSSVMGSEENPFGELGLIISTGYDLTMTNLQSDTMIYVLIIVFLSVSAAEFSSGSIKNLLSIGKPRYLVYLSKLTTSCAWGACAVLLYGVICALFGYLFMADVPTAREIGNIALILLRQLPVYLVMICFGHMLMFTMQKTAPTILIYLGAFLASEMIIPIVDIMIDGSFKASWLVSIYQLVELSTFGTSVPALVTIYGSCALYLLVTVAGGYFLFKRSEIK